MVPELTRCQADKDSVFGREGEHLQTGVGGGGRNRYLQPRNVKRQY